MKTTSIASAAATTVISTAAGRLFTVLVTTAGTGTGNVVFVDGYKGTDLAIDATDLTKVTSASHNFVAADVGKALTITAGTGFTTGTYRIASVASNAAFVDRPMGTASSTSGTWALGNGAITIFQLPATVSVNTFYVVGPYGTPYGTDLHVTNVASGPVLMVVYS